MIGTVLVIASWLIAGGTAYYFMATSGKKLKEIDNNLTEEDIKKDSPSLKALAESNKLTVTTLTEGLKTKEESLKTKTDKDEIATINKEIAEDKKKLEVAQTKQKLAENVVGYGTWFPVLTWQNIAWTLGIFVAVGSILTIISKWIASFFHEKQ